MRTHLQLALKTTLGLWGVAVLLPLFLGCGGESAKPAPQINVMGGVLIAKNSPAGGPYQAGAVVSVGGSAISDATVTMNGAPLTYQTDPLHQGQDGYVGLVSATVGSEITLTVSCSAGSKTLHAQVPGPVTITSPAANTRLRGAEDLPVTWTSPTGASLIIITCAGASTATPNMWMVSASTTSYTIPASYLTPPGNRIMVMGLGGSGDLPSLTMSQWVGKTGLWITTEDWVDVINL